MLGYMYVFEGSTLGGHQITKHVKKILPVTEESGVSFYNSYGQDLGHYWSSFSEAVNQWGKENPDKHELVIASANRCFDEIHQSFFNLNPKNIA
jgi:heme oxygenase